MTPERWQQIESLYHLVLKQGLSRRKAYLQETCAGDAELRREVESLLVQGAEAENFIERPAVEVAASLMQEKRIQSLIGHQLGSYKVLSLLGVGGMGEVYLAQDQRLERTVALKILPTELASDPDRMRRFVREAKAACSLKHPNVATVHEMGEYNGLHFIAMEYVEGQTLASKISGRPLEIAAIVEIALQVADALDEAHGKHITHRDIKPANIMLTPRGQVKVLDFGLAKVTRPEGGAVSSDLSTAMSTETGVVMGTLQYMSPEQVLGKAIDPRTDIFSLGAVLYEMATGRLAFPGVGPSETTDRILHGQPEAIARFNYNTPRELERIVRKSLEKDQERRHQSARELLIDLKNLKRDMYPEATAGIPNRSQTTPVSRRMLLASVILTLAVAAGVLAWRLDRSEYWWQNPLANAQFMPLTDSGAEGDAVISRDGKFVVFLSDRDGPSDVWAGQIGTGEFQNLTKGRAPDIGNPRVRNLSFSPDGSQVSVEVRIMGRAYSWAVPTIGGLVRPYMDGVELAWSPDGTRIAYHTDAAGDPIFVAEANQKVGKQIYAAERGVHCHYLGWSPKGAFIYFVQGFPPDEMDIWRIRPTGGAAEQITFHNSRVAYPTLLDERKLLYIARADDGTGPWLYEMDPERRVPHRISFGVERYTSVAASGDGQRLVATVANPDASLWRVPISDRMIEESGATRVALPTVRGLSPRMGPGYIRYLSSKSGNDGIWKLTDKTAVELWSGSLGRVLEGPAISPDGGRIAFTARKSGRNRLYLMNANGTNVTQLADSLDVRGAPAWPPVGEWITVAADQGKGARLFKIPLDGGPPIQLIEEHAMNPVWSPDGRFLVYSGVEVGTTFPVKAVTADGKPHRLPELILSRGANHFSFMPGRPVLVVLKGDVWNKNFWLIDLITGQQRQLTNFSREFLIGDFDLSPDGQEIIFGRVKENSNVILIDLPRR
jgi:serine/threonine protein kinase/Tol biopolymer transport system component